MGPAARQSLEAPAAEVRAWLEATRIGEGGARLVTLPIVLRRAEVGFALAGARIGASADALAIDVVDAALGIGLNDRARPFAAQATCAFLVDGYWGATHFDVTGVRAVLSPSMLPRVTHATFTSVVDRDV